MNIVTVNRESGVTAYELILKKPPNLKMLHPFGAKCYIYNQKTNRGKFDPRGIPGMMVGLCEESMGYRIWRPNAKTIIMLVAAHLSGCVFVEL